MDNSAISIQNLTKRYGTFTAVDNVSMNIKEKELYALIGPNGAGKTTLIKILVGLLIPTSGSIRIFGNDILNKPITSKGLFGYVSDDPSAYEYLTGLEFLTLTGRLRGMTGSSTKERIDELMPLFPMGDVLKSPMAYYSRGNKQKVAVLSAMLAKPKLLIIDEPLVGLDPESIRILGSALSKYAELGNTVFFVTHILSFAASYAKRVGIMREGKILKETAVTKSTDLEGLLQA